MNATQFEKQTDFRIGCVDFKQKSKSCGKQNCGACPHGGFWYAYLPSWRAVNSDGRRVEIYLGRAWNDGDLKAKVAPRLKPDARKDFLAYIDAQLDQERLEAINRQLENTAGEIVRVQRQAEEQVKRLRAQEKKLQAERAAVAKRLDSGETNGYASHRAGRR